jgi:hypothetical protein
LDIPIECKNLVIYNIKFIGIKTIKVRLWEKNDDLIVYSNNNNYKFVYFNDYLIWQKPVITEYQIFQNLTNNKIIPYNYFAFPWAYICDSKYYKKYYYLNYILASYKKSNIQYFTINQHIFFRKVLKVCKYFNIKYIFTPHKLISDIKLEKELDIKIIPISLYPVQHRKLNEKLIDISNKKFLTSFIGFYDSKIYLSNIRKKIFDIFNKYEDCLIKQTNEWHYQSHVYRDKIKDNLNIYEKDYKLLLNESKFSLCPSGTGPNSIRIWEAISYGSIPVILADNLVLPEITGVNYHECFIFWKESDINDLYEYLKNIDIITIENMSKKCIELFNNYFAPDKMHLQVLEYFRRI